MRPESIDGFDYRTRPPGSALAPFVRRLWYARGRIAYRRDHILPDGRAVLLINLGAPHVARPTARRGPPRILREAWVCGLQTRALVNEPLGETQVVGASFATAGAAAFFSLPLSELADRAVPLEELWGSAARALRERVADAPTPDAKLACLERGLLEHRLPTPRGLSRVDAALGQLLAPRRPPLKAVAERVQITPKQLISDFHRLVGVTPGALARIVRLRRLLDAIDPRQEVPWPRLASSHGWSDQPHLIRDFRTFTGATPTEYVRRRKEAFGSDLEPGQDAIFLPSE